MTMTNEDKEMIKYEDKIRCTLLYKDPDNGNLHYIGYYLKKSSPLATFCDEYDYNPFVREDYLLEYDALTKRQFGSCEDADIFIMKTDFVKDCEYEGLYHIQNLGVKNSLKSLGEIITEFSKNEESA